MSWAQSCLGHLRARLLGLPAVRMPRVPACTLQMNQALLPFSGAINRSERVAGIDAPNYNENAHLLSLADGAGEGSGRDRRLMRGAHQAFRASHAPAHSFVGGCKLCTAWNEAAWAVEHLPRAVWPNRCSQQSYWPRLLACPCRERQRGDLQRKAPGCTRLVPARVVRLHQVAHCQSYCLGRAVGLLAAKPCSAPPCLMLAARYSMTTPDACSYANHQGLGGNAVPPLPLFFMLAGSCLSMATTATASGEHATCCHAALLLVRRQCQPQPWHAALDTTLPQTPRLQSHVDQAYSLRLFVSPAPPFPCCGPQHL